MSFTVLSTIAIFLANLLAVWRWSIPARERLLMMGAASLLVLFTGLGEATGNPLLKGIARVLIPISAFAAVWGVGHDIRSGDRGGSA